MDEATLPLSTECRHSVAVPPAQPFINFLGFKMKETFFPDDPFRRFNNQPPLKKFVLALQYLIPILEWLPRYRLEKFKCDLISGITIASLAIPQGISYAKLAFLPPILGLYSSFIPPLVYAMMGTSRDLAVGNVAVPSLLIASILGKEVSPATDPELYLSLALTATFFAGVFQASLGLLRLGFLVDLLSHATIIGFMGGAATVVCLQQLKGIFGLHHFTKETDIASVMKSIFSQTHQWQWESVVMGCSFLFYILLTRYFSKRRPVFFWISTAAPLTCVILGTLLVYLTDAEKHGIQVIGHLHKGLNPPSIKQLEFGSTFLMACVKTGIITAIIGLAEGIAVGRSFAFYKNYHIDANKEMTAMGVMNVVGSCTTCYLTSGPFSRSAVNFNAGCKSAFSNVVMALTVMLSLLFLTPLFQHTPLVVLSSIIICAMLPLIDYNTAIHLWKVDKADFLICISAYFGVIFGTVEIGLAISVMASTIRILMLVVRPMTCVLGNIIGTRIYRNVDQYLDAKCVPGAVIIQINAPICFANANYLRERITRWIDDFELRGKESLGSTLQFLILDLGAVTNIDTSGINLLQEVKTITDRRDLKMILVNPGMEVMKKLYKSNFVDTIGQESIYLTLGEAIATCNSTLHKCSYMHVKESNHNV